MGDFKEPAALYDKIEQGNLPQVLAASPISDALITQIPADEEPLCGNAAVYAIIFLLLLLLQSNLY